MVFVVLNVIWEVCVFEEVGNCLNGWAKVCEGCSGFPEICWGSVGNWFVFVVLHVLIYSINVFHGKSIMLWFVLSAIPCICVQGLMVVSAVLLGSICKLQFYVRLGGLRCGV